MKRLIVLFLFLSIIISAQSKFSIGGSIHSVIPYHASDRLGYGLTVDLSYQLFSDFELNFSTGYFAWGNNAENNHKVRVVPDFLGVKYYFLDYGENLKFYAQGQVQKLTGNLYQDVYYFDNELDENVYSHIKTEKLSEFGYIFGLGTIIALDENFALDINSQIRLFYDNPHFKTISISSGIKYFL